MLLYLLLKAMEMMGFAWFYSHSLVFIRPFHKSTIPDKKFSSLGELIPISEIGQSGIPKSWSQQFISLLVKGIYILLAELTHILKAELIHIS